MNHLTLNTGDSRESPRREVNNTVITLLTPVGVPVVNVQKMSRSFQGGKVKAFCTFHRL